MDVETVAAFCVVLFFAFALAMDIALRERASKKIT